MKAYNVIIKKFGENAYCMTWENYAFGKYCRKFKNEAEAFEYLKREGWEIMKG